MRPVHYTAILGILLIIAAYYIGLKTDQRAVLAALAQRQADLQAPPVDAPLE